MTLFMIGLAYSPPARALAYREKRLLNGLAPAERALAGLPEPFPLRKNKTAFPAFRRSDDKVLAEFAYCLPDVFKMTVHFPLRNPDFSGDLSGREHPLLKCRRYLMPNRIRHAHRDWRLIWSLFHVGR